MDLPDFFPVYGYHFKSSTEGYPLQYKRYGAPLRVAGTVSCPLEDWKVLINLTGVKGQIYAGFVGASGTVYGSDSIKVTIDGTFMGGTTFENAYNYNMVKPYGYPLFLISYDCTANALKLAIGLTPGYTFESSYKVEYYNTYPIARDIDYELIYSIIS